MTDIKMDSVIIRNYQSQDKGEVFHLYNRINSQYENIIYWWPSDDPQTWKDIFCGFYENQLIAKGQIFVIDIVSSGSSDESYHQIFINLKVDPRYDYMKELKDAIYEKLYIRVSEIKETLPKEYRTYLCVGNYACEENNNRYFTGNDFKKLYSSYHLIHNLDKDDYSVSINPKYNLIFNKLDSIEERNDYIRLELEVWPDSAIGLKRLDQYKTYNHFSLIQVSDGNEIVGSVMVWEENGDGRIENVFVRDNWRKQGIAKFMISKGFDYLRDKGFNKVHIMTDSENVKALSLYKSVGFKIHTEEKRYYIEL